MDTKHKTPTHKTLKHNLIGNIAQHKLYRFMDVSNIVYEEKQEKKKHSALCDFIRRKLIFEGSYNGFSKQFCNFVTLHELLHLYFKHDYWIPIHDNRSKGEEYFPPISRSVKFNLLNVVMDKHLHLYISELFMPEITVRNSKDNQKIFSPEINRELYKFFGFEEDFDPFYNANKSKAQMLLNGNYLKHEHIFKNISLYSKYKRWFDHIYPPKFSFIHSPANLKVSQNKQTITKDNIKEYIKLFPNVEDRCGMLDLYKLRSRLHRLTGDDNYKQIVSNSDIFSYKLHTILNKYCPNNFDSTFSDNITLYLKGIVTKNDAENFKQSISPTLESLFFYITGFNTTRLNGNFAKYPPNTYKFNFEEYYNVEILFYLINRNTDTTQSQWTQKECISNINHKFQQGSDENKYQDAKPHTTMSDENKKELQDLESDIMNYAIFESDSSEPRNINNSDSRKKYNPLYKKTIMKWCKSIVDKTIIDTVSYSKPNFKKPLKFPLLKPSISKTKSTGNKHKIAVYLDCSGSISDNTLLRTLKSVINTQVDFEDYCNCDAYLWDTKVREYYKVTKLLRNHLNSNSFVRKNHGGTDVDCVFKHINKQPKTTLPIIFTDLEFSNASIKCNKRAIFIKIDEPGEDNKLYDKKVYNNIKKNHMLFHENDKRISTCFS